MTNQTIKHVLSNYLAVMTNQQLSRCKVAFFMDAKDSDDEEHLWREHEHLKKDFNQFYKERSSLDQHVVEKIADTLRSNKTEPFFSYLDLKVKLAEKIFHHCNFCEKACEVNRNLEKGCCGVKNPLIASEFLHVGEEPVLVPSHTVFFAGCNFNCVYCQNWDISQQPTRGISVEAKNLALIIEKRINEGSRNVNFVGGDPTPNLHYILRTMQLVRKNIPVIWNSNMYLSEDAMHLLDGFADLYLTDFKYGNNECAQRLSSIPDYMEVVERNHKMAWEAGDIIIRHLVLPNHVECCSKPLLRWISQNLGREVVLNIMGQYHPVYHADKYEEISRLPTYGEVGEVIDYAKGVGFKNLL
ncbi:radical SAM protein [Methanobacterium petrolearium]|uniref:radical SAM protein n=1 Tax=Methanobacterium petrolearium TaxID=710190 RepID=UPI001FD75F51|nr:radical SAM protein [Methanobacterium petrolearium]